MFYLFRLLFAFTLFSFVTGAGADQYFGDDDYQSSDISAYKVADASSGMKQLPIVPDAGSGSVIISNKEYHIGPSDKLEIEVFQVPDLSGIETVNSRGYINMPLIGMVPVAGLTEQQAEQLIADKLGKDFLQDPQVNIDIIEYVSQQITILGSVKAPGVYPLKGRTTLLQAIAMAGGPERIADEEEIVVFRTDKTGAVAGYIVNLEDIQAGKKKDPEMIGNDRIVVPESGSRALIKGVSDTLRGFVGFRPY